MLPDHLNPNIEPLEEDMDSDEEDVRKVFHGESYEGGRRSTGSLVLDDPFELLPDRGEGDDGSDSHMHDSNITGEIL